LRPPNSRMLRVLEGGSKKKTQWTLRSGCGRDILAVGGLRPHDRGTGGGGGFLVGGEGRLGGVDFRQQVWKVGTGAEILEKKKSPKDTLDNWECP